MKSKTNGKKRRKVLTGIILATLGLAAASCAFLIYNILLWSGIENIIRYIAVGVIGVIFIGIALLAIKAIKKHKIKFVLIFLLLAILITALFTVGSLYINKAYSSINNLNKSSVTYSTSLITLSDSGIESVADLDGKKIGIIKDTDSIEGYIISQGIIKDEGIDKDSLVSYDDFLSMLNELYEGNVDAIFVSSGYVSMFSTIEHFANIKEETLVLATKTKVSEKTSSQTSTTTAAITEPFTMLLLGIDSETDDISNATSFNGDSIMLLTFNPITLNATMLSIPRDTFVPITCFRGDIQNKITHAAWYGESCMIDTIENFTGINIDYYAKINFKGVVNLVDALGGVDVEVPYSFCEQDSNRYFGSNTVYVTKGYQTLNGESALALSRNRHTNSDKCSAKWTYGDRNDFVRGQNQQLVIKAIINKVKDVRDISSLYSILDVVEKNMDTDLTTNQILSFYNIAKDILKTSKVDGDVLNFQKLYLQTYGAMIYDEGMGLVLSDQIYYKQSLAEVVDAMQINLGLKEATVVKTFAFSVNETYVETVIGKGTYNEAIVALVPDFSSYTKTSATAWGVRNGIPITFKEVESSASYYKDGQITNQSYKAKSLMSLVSKSSGITLTVIKKAAVVTPVVPDDDDATSLIDCTVSANSATEACRVHNFVTEKYTSANLKTWAGKLTAASVNVVISTETVATTNSVEDGFVAEQSVSSGTFLYSLTSPRTITFKLFDYTE